MASTLTLLASLVGKGVLGLCHADGQLVEAHAGVLLDGGLCSLRVLNTGGMVQLLGNDLNLVL